MIDTDF